MYKCNIRSRNKSWKEFRSSVLSVSGSSGSSGCLNEPSLMQCFVATTGACKFNKQTNN